MLLTSSRREAFQPLHGVVGAALIAVGEALIIARARPLSDFYFPFVWLGYVLLLDGAIFRQRGRSLWMSNRRHFLLMLPISACFWWLFEFFNQAVHNWTYVGASAYTGADYVVFASVDFSTVLLAVWSSAQFIDLLLPPGRTGAMTKPVLLPRWLPAFMLSIGLACLVLPVIWPSYFFGALWLSMFFLLDPINDRLGRPSMLAALRARRWRIPVCFALGGLMCGFFWEGWNYWSMPKWVYTIPHVNQWHVFEMPLLGWTGYLPFGLELFAMGNFVFYLLRVRPLGLIGFAATAPEASLKAPPARRREYSES
jgi:hypothetical protein